VTSTPQILSPDKARFPQAGWRLSRKLGAVREDAGDCRRLFLNSF